MARRRVRTWVALAVVGLVGVALLYSGVLSIRSEPVTFRNGDVTLSGRLVLPRFGEEPFPAAVIVHGSGRTGWSDMKGYARMLVPQGLAVLLYDKRGIGDSEGRYSSIRVADSVAELGKLAGDAAAAVEYLRGRPDVDPDRIGLLGGSQAGWIMPLAATSGADVAWIVAISGPAVTYGQEIHYSRLTGDDPGFYEGLDDAEIARRMAAFEGPHGYDPLPALRALSMPSLWVLGGSDRSVPIRETVAALESVREEGGLPLEILYYPTGDHSLRDVGTGKRIEYRTSVYDWLRKRGVIGER